MTRSLAVSPDGTTIAVGLWSGAIRLLDAVTGKETGDELRVAAPVTELGFVAEAGELVAVTQAGDFIVWDLASRQRLSEPLTAVDRGAGPATTFPALAVGPDFAVTASAREGKLAIWSLNPDDWIAEGCRVHRRNLTDPEKTRFGLEGAAPVCPG